MIISVHVIEPFEGSQRLPITSAIKLVEALADTVIVLICHICAVLIQAHFVTSVHHLVS